jgi:hypothetical protein
MILAAGVRRIVHREGVLALGSGPRRGGPEPGRFRIGWGESRGLDCVGAAGPVPGAGGVWGNWQPDGFWPR